MTGHIFSGNYFRQIFRFFLLTGFALLLSASSTFAQEICDNGIDDDGDNLVDVFDPDCPCDDQTLLCQPSCEFVSPGGALNFNSQWASASEVPIYQTPLVADMNNDNVPDVIIMSSNSLASAEPRRAKDILIINGATGATMSTITTPFMAWVGPDPYAVADIDNDGFGELIVASMDHTSNAVADRRYLYCYEHTGALKWKSDVQYGYPTIAKYGSAVGIADFNSDGIPEVYIYNQVFNALTGKKLAEGGSTNGLGLMANESFGDLANPVAANLTTHSGLELACGKSVYNVTLTNFSGTAGNTMTAITIPGQIDGYTSLADINLDGNLDVVVASQGTTGKIYVWNPNNGTPVLIASRTFGNTGGNWIGVPFIGDMDKDCQPEIGVTRSKRVYAMDYDGTTTLALKWTLVTTDASGFTGITMFDFNQDGTQEIVYRDETTLRIINGSGSSPVTIGTNPCTSGTGSDMPVVADVDGDGQAEICVTCATTGASLGRVNVFESSGQPWAPCRNIWNQYSYFNVNINNNLTIPLQQQQHQVLLSTITCPFFTCNQNRPFNNFMTQSTFLTQEGCPIYPASDVGITLGARECQGSTTYDLTFSVENVGGAPSDPNYPIKFYAGNPLTGAATLISSTPAIVQTGAALNPGDSQDISVTLDITTLPKPFNLFVVLNDAGASPTPFAFPLSSLPECDYSDNIASINNINCCPFGDLAINGITPPSATICQGSSTAITVNATSSAGLSNAVYTWTLPNSTTQTGQTINATLGGNYLISVKDNAQCNQGSAFNLTVTPQPTTASAGVDQTVCASTSTLEANVPVTGTGSWSLVTGTGTVVSPSSPTSNVTGLSVGANSFRWAIVSGGFCTSADTITINRLPVPSPANAGADQELCSNATSLSGNVPSVGTGNWTLVSGSGNITNPASNVSGVTGLGVGNNVFQWTISNGICAAEIDQVTIVRNAEPSIAIAGTDQDVCAATATLAATPAAAGTGAWTVISGGATVDSPASPTSTVSNLAIGANVFQWTITSGNCTPTNDQVIITRSATPTVSNAGSNQTICSATATLAGNVASVGSGIWTLQSGTGTIVTPSSPTSSVTGLGFGTNIFVWTISNGVCPPSTSQVSIIRDAPPSVPFAGNDQTICADNATLTADVPAIGTGIWQLISGTGTPANPSQASTAVTGLTPGANVFSFVVSNGTCPSTSDLVTINVDAPVTIPNAGEDQQVCAATAALNGNTPVTGTGLWSLVTGNATIVTPGSPTSQLTNLSFGTVVLQWTITNGTCSASDQVSINRNTPPTEADAGPDQLLCSTTAALDANTPTSGSGVWSVVSGTGNFDDPNNPDGIVNGLSVGPNVLAWTISSPSCTSSVNTVTITVSANPITPDAGESQSVCATTATLAAVPATIGTGAWTVISGSAIVTDPSSPTSAVTGLSAGANVFRWTITNAPCVAFDEVTINRDLPPSIAVAGTDIETCSTSVSLNADVPTSGSGAWTVVSGSGSITDSADETTSVTGLTPGTTILQWTVSSGVCAASTDQVSILVNDQPSPAVAGNDQTICTDSTSLSATLPVDGIGAWTLTSGTGTFADPSYENTAVTGLSLGTNTFTWTVSNGVCAPTTDLVSIVVDMPPTIADAGEDQTICSDTTSLFANTPSSGTGSWTIVTGSATFADASSPTTTVSGVGVGINVLQWNISNGTCAPNTDQVVISRDSLPVMADAGSDIGICNTDSVTLQGVNPFPGTGVWTLISGSGTFEDANSSSSLVTGLAIGPNVFRFTVTTGTCPPTFDEVTVTNSQPPTPSSAGADTSICATTLTLNAVAPTVGSGNWSDPDITAVFSDGTSETATVSNLHPGINTLIWTVSNGSCPSVSDSILVTVDKNPISPNAGADQSICSDTTTISAAIPSTGVGAWTVVSGTAVITDPASSQSAITGIGFGTTVIRWTITNGTCVAFDEAEIVRSEPPSPAVAGEDQTICGTTVTLAATAPSTGTGMWEVISGNGIFDDPADPSTSVTAIDTGDNIFRWMVSNGTCTPLTDDITIHRQAAPDVAVAGADTSVCADTVMLHAMQPLVSSGSWTLVSGTGIITDADSAITSVTGLGTGANVFRWTIPATPTCPETTDDITVTRDTPPSPALAGSDQEICTHEVTLIANAPAVGTGVWLVISGNAVIEDSLSATTLATNLGTGNNVFEWRISNGSCLNEADEVTISVGDTAFAGMDTVICDSTITLQASTPTSGTGVWTVVSGTGTFADSSSANTIVNGLSQGENIFEWTITGSLCPDSVDQVIVERRCNQPPVLVNDTIDIEEDSVLTGSLFDNGDFDPDSTSLVADTVPVSGPSSGTFDINSDGTFTYTPDANFYGSDTIIVQICDQGIPLPAICGFDTLIINISPVNDPPLVVNNTAITIQNVPVSGNILANNTDVEGGFSLDVIPDVFPTNGTIFIDEDGTFEYTPDDGFIGLDTVVIIVCDSGFPLPEFCVNDTLFIIVNDTINDPPILSNDEIALDEDSSGTGTIFTDDTDPDGTALTADTILVDEPNHGTFNINPDGTFTYIPNADYFGMDTVVVAVCDSGLPLPALCGNDTIIITINPVNDAPEIVNDDASGQPNGDITGNLLTNDSDIEGGLTVNTIPVSGPSNGSIVINDDGSFVYTPDADFEGSDTVYITVCDSGFPLPVMCGTDTLVINVSDSVDTNTPPDITNDAVTLNEDESGSGTILTDDSDPDGTALTVDTIPVSGPFHGTFAIDSNGVYTYVPDPNYYGADTIVISVCDAGLPLPAACANDTIFITVNPVNDSPEVVNDTAVTLGGQEISGNILDNDSDAEGGFTVNVVPVSGPENGSVIVTDDGSFTYTPNDDFIGIDTVVISVCDSGFPEPVICFNDTLFIFVNDTINAPPDLSNDSLTINEDNSGSGSILLDDSDPEGTVLTVDTNIVSGPSHGTFTINDQGIYTYTPDTNYYGLDTIIIAVCDSGLPLPAICANDTLIITINPVNDPPVIVNDTISVLPGEEITGNILDNDSDPDGTPLTIDTIPVGGPEHGEITIHDDGSFVYVPDDGFTGSDTIFITVCDSGFPLPVICDIDTLIILINDTLNSPPVITNDSLTLNEDNSGSGTILLDDSDPEATELTVDTALVDGPNHGTFTINEDGVYTYTPDSNYYGLDTVVIAVCDSGVPLPAECANDTLIITINPVNDAPVIENDSASTTPGTEVSGNILHNDSDEETALVIDTIPVSGPAHGTIDIAADGSFIYDPDEGFTGIDTIVVSICDSGFPLPVICDFDTLFITAGNIEFEVNAGPDQQICGFNGVLIADALPENATGLWTSVSGTVAFDPNDLPATQISNLASGANIIIWSVTLNDQTISDTVLITTSEPVTPPFAGEDQAICSGETQLQGNIPDVGTGLWGALTVGAQIISDPAESIVFVNNLDFGENVFTWTITNGACISIDTVVVVSTSPVEMSAGKDTSYCERETSIHLNAFVNGSAEGFWTMIDGNAIILEPQNPLTEITDLALGQNVFTFTVLNGACSVTDTVVINLLPESEAGCGGVFIPEGFSPNADGSHDYFVISGTGGKKITIEVFNRWGNKVYQNDNYLNDWNGVSNGGWIMAGDILPESTYFYVVQIEGETDVRKGYLTLWR